LVTGIVTAILQTEAQHSSCKLLITPDVTEIDGRSNASAVRPGDTICLLPGPKTHLALSYIHGTKESPVVICNVDGLVSISGYYFGLRFDSCSYIKLTGSGQSSLTYGIQITNVAGAGISVEGLSTDIEIERIEVAYTQLVGLFAKTDPDCNLKSVRGRYTLRNLLIHENYFHHTGMEGMYIGSSFYDGVTITCGGVDTTVLPHLLKGTKIFNNIIKNTGWDGIQVSCSDSCSEIRNNSIQNDSDSTIFNQMSGILLGGGSVCDCFNNMIQNGKGDGIDIFSLGSQKIYNNLIINQGRTYHPDENYYPYQKHGIFIGNNAVTPGTGFTIFNNTIISPKSTGIKFTNLSSINNLITNNIIINPGLYGSIGNEAFINISESSIDASVYNNYLNQDFTGIKFIDPSAYNFDLQPSSPAVNKGTGITGFPLLFDILNRSRPFSWQIDMGAFECQDSSLLQINENINKVTDQIEIFPNPGCGYFNICYSTTEKTNVRIDLYNTVGNKVMETVNGFQIPGKYESRISTEQLLPGLYTLIFQTEQIILSRKILVTNN